MTSSNQTKNFFEAEDLFNDLRDFCRVDLQLADRTARDHVWQVKRFLKAMDVSINDLSKEIIRSYLMRFTDKSKCTYANVLKSMKVFCRDYLGRDWLVKSFRFPSRPVTPEIVPSKELLRKFYGSLSLRNKALFLLYATTGLRKSEVLSLSIGDIDLEERVVRPEKDEGIRTKKVWISFFNEETKGVLKKYLATRMDDDPRLFRISLRSNLKTWRKTCRETEIRITPKVLRKWFACEMGSLGVPDRYVDAFCGRVPRSILARHYTDYSPERLKEVYDKAALKVLE